MNDELNHFDSAGKAVMVNVSEKKITAREAVASGKIFVRKDIFEIIKNGTAEKGDVLHSVSVALLTIYDMCKAVNKNMEISNIRLEKKSGGKSGTFQRWRD